VKVARRHWLRLGIGIAFAGAAVAALAAPGSLEALEGVLERMGLAQGLLVFCALSVVGTMLLIPAWIFPVAAGAVFGFGWGLAVAVVAAALAALAAFLAARFVFRDRIERVARREKAFAAVDKAVGRDPWKVVALLRLSPVLPSALKSYLLGITRVDALPYTLASMLGMFPGLAVKVLVGHAGRDALTGGGPLKWGLLAVGVAATLGMAYLVGRSARRRLRLDE
jgi:uncharacterized membrane protein YdjX (TVP38/TMEM64 family)